MKGSDRCYAAETGKFRFVSCSETNQTSLVVTNLRPEGYLLDMADAKMNYNRQHCETQPVRAGLVCNTSTNALKRNCR